MKRVKGPEDDHTATLGYACGPWAVFMLVLIIALTILGAIL